MNETGHVSAIWPAPAVIMATTTLIGSGPGALAPFHPLQQSPSGSDANCKGDQVFHVFPTLTGPGDAPRLAALSPDQVDNCLNSKFPFCNSLTVSLVGNSPLGITCNNTAPPSKAPPLT